MSQICCRQLLLKLALTFLLSISQLPASVAAESITIQGRLSTGAGIPVQGPATLFNVKILAPNASRCVLYDETQTLDMSNSRGLFSINLNNGLGVRNSPTTYSLSQAISNRAGFLINSASCQNGSGMVSYTPSVFDNRKVIISFKDPQTMGNFEVIPEMDLNPVPYALETRAVGGYQASDLVRVSDGPATPLTSANFAELINLIGGTSANYMTSTSGSTTGARLPTVVGNPSSPAIGSIWFDTSGSGSVKYKDSSGQVQTVNSASGNGTITGITAGGGLSGGGTTGTVSLSLSNSGVAAGTYGAANTVPVLTIDAYGRITAAATTAIAGTLPAGTNGAFLKSDGSAWTSQRITMADLKSTVGSADLFVSPGCTAAQSLYWDSGTDQIKCQAIAGLDASSISAGILADGRLPDVGTAGSYRIVTTDAKGRVTAGSNPTTLAGFGISDAVVNAGGIPSVSSGLFSGRPAFGVTGRLYLSSDTLTLYRDTGSAWEVVGSPGGGAAITEITAGTGLAGGGTSGNVTISLGNVGAAGTYAKVTTDAQGRVTAGAALSETDIPNLDWSKINAGKPTSIGGYGITDAVSNAGSAVSFAAGLASGRPAPGTSGRFYFSTDAKVLSYDTGATWTELSSGTSAVQSIAVSAPITNTGTSLAPQLAIAAATASTSGYLSSSDWTTFSGKLGSALGTALIWVGNSANVATPVSPSGDVGMSTTGAFTVTKIQGTAVAAAAPLAGQFFSFAGGNWLGKNINLTDLKSTSAGAPPLLPAPACTAGQSLYWDSGTDQIKCQAIALDGGAIATGTIDPARLPAALWSENSGNIFRATGNVGIGTPVAASLLANTSTNSLDEGGLGAAPAGLTWLANAVGYVQTLTNSAGNPGANGLLVRTTGTAATNRILELNSGGISRMAVTGPGRVGIGTALPGGMLDVQTSEPGSAFNGISNTFFISAINAPQFLFRKARGTQSAPAAILNEDAIGNTLYQGYDGSNFTVGASLTAKASEDWNASSRGTYLVFNTVANGSTSLSERLRITASGRVGIGVAAPSSILHLAPGTAAPGNAPLKFSAGTNLTAPEDGAMEYNGSTYYLTIGSTRYAIPLNGSSASFSSIATGDGSAGSPSHSFANDPNTGFFSSAPDAIGLAAGGVKTFDFSAAGIISPVTGGGAVSSANGTAASPTYSFGGDSDTGWYRPAADTLAASTGGTERLRIDASGRVGIGTTSPTALLTLMKPTATATYNDALIIDNPPNLGPYMGSSMVLNAIGINGVRLYTSITDATAGSEATDFLVQNYRSGVWLDRFKISSDGNVGIGTTAPTARLTVSSNTGSLPAGPADTLVHLANTDSTGSRILLDGFSGNPNFTLRSAGGTANSPSALTAGQSIGTIAGFGHMGTGYVTSGRAYIQFRAAENWSSSANGTDLAFGTTPNGATASAERLRIDQSGNVGIGTTSPALSLDVMAGPSDTRGIGVQYYSGNTNAPQVNLFKGRGTASAPSAVLTNDVLGNFTTRGYDGTNAWSANVGSTGTSIRGWAAENWTSSAHGSYLTLETTPNGSTTTSPAMTILGNGNVGIGTTSPSEKLQVDGAIQAKSGSPTANNSNHVGYVFGGEQDGGMFSPADGTVVFATNGSEQIRIDSAGRVGVGSTTPTEKMHIVGNLRVQGSTDCTLGNGAGGTNCSSDIRLKQDISPIANALSKLLSLRGVDFTWNQLAQTPGRHDIGLIAQEVEKVFPTAVSSDPVSGVKKVDYAILVAPVIQALKTLSGRINSLSPEVDSAKREISGLKEKLTLREAELSRLKAAGARLESRIFAMEQAGAAERAAVNRQLSELKLVIQEMKKASHRGK